MPPSTRLPTLHLYRHLLREASYLPPACTPWVREQITTRFKKHARPTPTTPATLTSYRIRLAHSKLRTLRAANAGHAQIITKILDLVYGRVGRRRRILMTDFLYSKSKTPPAATTPSPTPPPPTPTTTTTTTSSNTDPLAAKEAAQRAANPPQVNVTKAHKVRNALKQALLRPAALPPPPRADWLEAWNLPGLHALATSQVQHPFTSTAPDLKAAHARAPSEAHIPRLNIWGKPLTPRLARHKLRRWYAAMVTRIMPPVPRAEWDALGVLARGGGAWRVPARRTRARETTTTTTMTTTKEKEGAWDWRLYATAPVRSLERGQSRSERPRTGQPAIAPYGTGKPVGLVRLDRARLWQRLYMRVWAATPTIEDNKGEEGKKAEELEGKKAAGGERKEPRVLWGGESKQAQKPRAGQLAFFANVPDGALLVGKSKKLRKKSF